MKYIHLAFILMTAFFLTACYDMKQDDKGRTIKVNKITGELSVIEGDRIIKLKNDKEVRQEQEATKRLGETKNWPDIPLSIAGGATARLATKWSDDKLYYQLFIDKNLRAKGNYFSALSG